MKYCHSTISFLTGFAITTVGGGGAWLLLASNNSQGYKETAPEDNKVSSPRPRAERGGLTSWSQLLEHVPEFGVELVRLLQHRVVADAVDGDRPEVGVLLVGLDGRGG